MKKEQTLRKARITRVWIEHKPDDSPDTSHLGSYGKSALSDFAIDRKERGDMERNEFQWFNPNVENYEGESKASILQYCAEDYKRMESLNRGDWCFIGIIAKAEIVSPQGVCQTIRSGGLWGVESDSGGEYLASIAKEELAALRSELEAIGFGARAITRAFQSVQHPN